MLSFDIFLCKVGLLVVEIRFAVPNWLAGYAWTGFAARHFCVETAAQPFCLGKPCCSIRRQIACVVISLEFL